MGETLKKLPIFKYRIFYPPAGWPVVLCHFGQQWGGGGGEEAWTWFAGVNVSSKGQRGHQSKLGPIVSCVQGVAAINVSSLGGGGGGVEQKPGLGRGG